MDQYSGPHRLFIKADTKLKKEKKYPQQQQHQDKTIIESTEKYLHIACSKKILLGILPEEDQLKFQGSG